ncbi:alpha/beta fold hydrolase [Nonomuraea sp. NPDC049421]|uniref:alpha/beta fold hydrolase n=1 Tax=Nonomuraea sp. NPDC049421 TaxID=3155275 RepID=UPI00341834E5
MERRLYVFAACAFIMAAVLGSAWITGQFTTPAVDRTHGYVSELAARDQPWSPLFRAGDALSGLACVLGVLLVPRVVREWPGWLALAAFGVFTFLGGLFPLDCATLSDPACGGSGTSLSHLLHGLTGASGTLAVLAAMALLGVRWRSWLSWALTWLSLVATLLLVIALIAGHGAGLAHRAQLTVIAFWLVYVALHLLVADDPAPAPVTGDDPYGEDGCLRVAPGRMGGVGGARVLPPPPPDAAARVRVSHHADTHVVEEGAGPTVLITSGPGGAWFHWDAVAGLLAGSRRVVRFDRPGLGRSARPVAPPTLYAEVARLVALAPAHPERVTLVAHGVACWHAEAFARLHPLCLAGLVLVDPACVTGRRPLAAARTAGRWLPVLGGTWGAAVVARLAGPAAHRLLTGRPDPSGVSTMGKVPAAMAGEWLARRDMAADLLLLRAGKPFPAVPVTVISGDDADACQARLATALGAAHVRLPVAGRRLPLRAPQAIADAVNA